MSDEVFHTIVYLCPITLSIVLGFLIVDSSNHFRRSLRRIILWLWVVLSIVIILAGLVVGRLYSYIVVHNMVVDSSLPLRPGLIISGVLMVQALVGISLLVWMRKQNP